LFIIVIMVLGIVLRQVRGLQSKIELDYCHKDNHCQ
jgi:hypothetical protein